MLAIPTSSSCERPVPSSSLAAMRVLRESFREPGLTFALYSRIEISQIWPINNMLGTHTWMNSSLERVHSTFFHGIFCMILNNVGNNPEKTYRHSCSPVSVYVAQRNLRNEFNLSDSGPNNRPLEIPAISKFS